MSVCRCELVWVRECAVVWLKWILASTLLETWARWRCTCLKLFHIYAYACLTSMLTWHVVLQPAYVRKNARFTCTRFYVNMREYFRMHAHGMHIWVGTHVHGFVHAWKCKSMKVRERKKNVRVTVSVHPCMCARVHMWAWYFENCMWIQRIFSHALDEAVQSLRLLSSLPRSPVPQPSSWQQSSQRKCGPTMIFRDHAHSCCAILRNPPLAGKATAIFPGYSVCVVHAEWVEFFFSSIGEKHATAHKKSWMPGALPGEGPTTSAAPPRRQSSKMGAAPTTSAVPCSFRNLPCSLNLATRFTASLLMDVSLVHSVSLMCIRVHPARITLLLLPYDPPKGESEFRCRKADASARSARMSTSWNPKGQKYDCRLYGIWFFGRRSRLISSPRDSWEAWWSVCAWELPLWIFISTHDTKVRGDIRWSFAPCLWSTTAASKEEKILEKKKSLTQIQASVHVAPSSRLQGTLQGSQWRLALAAWTFMCVCTKWLYLESSSFFYHCIALLVFSYLFRFWFLIKVV
jgi:hypothetical protein